MYTIHWPMSPICKNQVRIWITLSSCHMYHSEGKGRGGLPWLHHMDTDFSLCCQTGLVRGEWERWRQSGSDSIGHILVRKLPIQLQRQKQSFEYHVSLYDTCGYHMIKWLSHDKDGHTSCIFWKTSLTVSIRVTEYHIGFWCVCDQCMTIMC